MDIRDSLNLVTAERMASLAKAVGTPPPVRVQLLDRPRRQALYGVKFAPASGVPAMVLSIDLVPTSRGYPLAHQWASLALLQFTDEIPAQKNFTPLPANLFGVPSSLSPFQDLVSGARVIGLDNDQWPRVAADLGKVFAALADHPVSTFGTRAESGRFVPVTGSWKQEWATHVHALYEGARAVGTDLGPVSDAILGAIEDRLDALDGVSPTLVHGQLRLDSLMYSGKGGHTELKQVTGWDLAMAGDSLVDAAHLLSSPVPIAGPILAAYGADRVRAWLDADTLRRLEIYTLTGLLQRARFVADHILNVRDTSTLGTLAVLPQQAAEALEPGFLRGRIEAVLEHLEPTVLPASSNEVAPVKVTARHALELLRVDPAIDASSAPLLLAAFGAVGLASRCPQHQEACDSAVQQLKAALPRFGMSFSGQPIADREVWKAELADTALKAATENPVPCLALLLLWTGLQTFDAVDWAVGDRTLRRLEAVVRSAMVDDAIKAQGGAVDQHLALTHAILGLGALADLTEQISGITVDTAGLKAELEDRSLELLERIDPTAIPLPTTSAPEVELDAAMVGLVGQQPLTRPVLVLGLAAAGGKATLPASVTQIVKHSGQ